MRLFHAEMKIDNCTAELWLNGVPLQRIAPGGIVNTAIPAHMYLLSGRNTLEVLIEPGSRPTLARVAWPLSVPQGSVTTRLAAYYPDQFTGDPNAPVYVRLNWDGAAAFPGLYPRSIQGSEDLGPMFGRWHWEAADTLRLDANTIRDAARVLESIRISLAAGNADVFLRLAEQRFANFARAYPSRSFDTLVRQFRAVVARDSASAGWGFPELSPLQIDFRVVGGGRLLECVNEDWQPTLRSFSLADGYPKYYPLFLCKLGDRWQVAI